MRLMVSAAAVANRALPRTSLFSRLEIGVLIFQFRQSARHARRAGCIIPHSTANLTNAHFYNNKGQFKIGWKQTKAKNING